MTTPLPQPGTATPEDRTAISRRFLQQAREELQRDDRLQASEKTWGAVAQALKAIAQRRGWRHRGHDYVVDIGHQIGKEYGDPDIVAATDKADQLHRNFYENNDNAVVIERTMNLVEDVLPLLEDIQVAAPRPFTIATREDRERLRLITGDRSLQIGGTSPSGFSLNHSPGPTGDGLG